MLNKLLPSCWLSFYLCYVFSSALESSKIRPSKTLQVDIFVLLRIGNMYTLCDFNFLRPNHPQENRGLANHSVT